jgi:hypothetical protein
MCVYIGQVSVLELMLDSWHEASIELGHIQSKVANLVIKIEQAGDRIRILDVCEDV